MGYIAGGGFSRLHTVIHVITCMFKPLLSTPALIWLFLVEMYLDRRPEMSSSHCYGSTPPCSWFSRKMSPTPPRCQSSAGSISRCFLDQHYAVTCFLWRMTGTCRISMLIRGKRNRCKRPKTEGSSLTTDWILIVFAQTSTGGFTSY